MTIAAQVIADSISQTGIRLTTLQLRYPKFIHGEFMTHRVFSRNASSSRAIPVERLIADIRRDPAMPVFWGSNKPGMQAGEEVSSTDLAIVKEAWLFAMESAIKEAKIMTSAGLHKQIANRIIEPWCHINVVVTATEWENFFALRCHPDAQPEMRVLAESIERAMDESKPRLMAPDAWHLPYISAADYEDIDGFCRSQGEGRQTDDLAIKCSVARCARVSYLTHEAKVPTLEEDLALYERLVGAHPIHASPAEHQAKPDKWAGRENGPWCLPRLHGNFRGWIQYRKTLKGENITKRGQA